MCEHKTEMNNAKCLKPKNYKRVYKWIRWDSLKTPEQRAIDRQKYITEYYRKLDNKNLFDGI